MNLEHIAAFDELYRLRTAFNTTNMAQMNGLANQINYSGYLDFPNDGYMKITFLLQTKYHIFFWKAIWRLDYLKIDMRFSLDCGIDYFKYCIGWKDFAYCRKIVVAQLLSTDQSIHWHQ